MRAIDVTIGGKRDLVCGYGDVGMDCALALCGCTCPDLRAAGMHGEIPGGRRRERRVGDRHLGAVNRDAPHHLAGPHEEEQQRYRAEKSGTSDNETGMRCVEGLEGMQVDIFKLKVDRSVFLDGHCGIVFASGRQHNSLSCATDHSSSARRVSAQLDVSRNWTTSKPYEKRRLPGLSSPG